MSDEIYELFAARKEQSQIKRASNREHSKSLLEMAGVQYVTANGTHIIVQAGTKIIDFWPGTGLWIVRGEPARYRGVHSLIKYCKEQ